MSEERKGVEDLSEILRSFSVAYPESVFTPFTKEETAAHALVITRASGAMGRHVAPFMARAADAIDRLERDRGRLVEMVQTLVTTSEALDEYIRTGRADNQQRRNSEAVDLARALLAELEKQG